MEILFDRDIRTQRSTTSKVYVDGEFECFSIEDRDRRLSTDMPLDEITAKKVKGQTAIPEGKYKCIVTHSNRFDRPLPLLVNVPGFEGVRIHPGNTSADTEGCLLPGVSRQVDFVGSSRVAFEKLFIKIKNAIAADQQVWIIIKP